MLRSANSEERHRSATGNGRRPYRATRTALQTRQRPSSATVGYRGTEFGIRSHPLPYPALWRGFPRPRLIAMPNGHRRSEPRWHRPRPL